MKLLFRGFKTGLLTLLFSFLISLVYGQTDPTYTTEAATEIGNTTATLNGSIINPDGLNNTLTFEYGLTTIYGSTIAADPNTSSSTNFTVKKGITNLKPNTTYHFRLVGMYGANTGFGLDQTFTTGGIAIPTMSQWGLLLFGLLILNLGVFLVQKTNRVQN